MGRFWSISRVSFSITHLPQRAALREALSIVSSTSLLIVIFRPMDCKAMLDGVLASLSGAIEQDDGRAMGNSPSCADTVLPFTWLIYTDRLYLASYTTPPSADTLFPYPDPPSRRSPSKRSARAIEGPSIVSERDRTPPCYFSIDDTLLYNAFHHDFGPLHIGHLYRFAVQFHDILGAPENKNRPVVFWSKADARSK
jgi:hypothetical protein